MGRHLALSEKLASIGTLAAGVSHEINNPISVIGNKVEIPSKGRVFYPVRAGEGCVLRPPMELEGQANCCTLSTRAACCHGSAMLLHCTKILV